MTIPTDAPATQGNVLKNCVALESFETALRELRAPSRAVIAQAFRQMFEAARVHAKAKRTQARQHEAELSDAFHAYLILHEDTSAFVKLKAEKGRLLWLSSEKGADHG